MNAFKDYLITEYKDKAQGFVATEFKFTHSTNIKLDKTSNKHLKIDIIKVTLKLFDKDLNQLHTASISFENNVIPKTKAKQLINISPIELENKFGFAKHEICNEIYKELKEKGEDCDLDKIEEDIIARDKQDMSREIAPLKQAEDAVFVDTSYMTIPEVVTTIREIAESKR